MAGTARRAEDPLPQPPYGFLSRAPIHCAPARRIVLRSVHHHHGVQLAPFLRPCPSSASTPGTAVLLPARCRARPAPAASRRPVPAPRNCIPPAGSSITGHQRGFTRFTRPVCPSPVAPGWDGRPLGLSLCSAPRRYRRRTTGRGRAVSTRPELRDRHSRPSNPRVTGSSPRPAATRWRWWSWRGR